jgi:hypothetical protein
MDGPIIRIIQRYVDMDKRVFDFLHDSMRESDILFPPVLPQVVSSTHLDLVDDRSDRRIRTKQLLQVLHAIV